MTTDKFDCALMHPVKVRSNGDHAELAGDPLLMSCDCGARLAEIRARAAAAPTVPLIVGGVNAVNDAEDAYKSLLAHASTDIPYLLDQIAARDAEIAAKNAEIERLRVNDTSF